MRSIIKHFISTNPTRNTVVPIVIDKDFVEWRVLEETYPVATVLLCQFHVISYWKKLVAKEKYNLTQTEKDDILWFVVKMVYR
ncbi:hypothetical protein JG688_00004853 [Phytophthora aleatoria]|uniref:ZSWIM1/3 RNaseH-like domain-containing protein n=1 Tax=Phytophthora aleatoria TaxID=2496075 RepID=A0A8J5M6Z1_9STRA|nr:hypothetical protein JG688_00004853 [Phytophthora aleatoria]